MKIKVALIGTGKTGKVVANSLFHDRRFDFVFAVKRTPAKPEDFHFVVEPVDMLPQLIRKFQPQIIVDFSNHCLKLVMWFINQIKLTNL